MAKKKKSAYSKAKKAPLGSGKRFKALAEDLKGEVRDPDAVAAAIGRKKHGKTKMAKLAAKGKAKKAKLAAKGRKKK